MVWGAPLTIPCSLCKGGEAVLDYGASGYYWCTSCFFQAPSALSLRDTAADRIWEKVDRSGKRWAVIKEYTARDWYGYQRKPRCRAHAFKKNRTGA